MRRERGFTFIEFLIVVTIVGLITAVVIPVAHYGSQTDHAQVKRVVSSEAIHSTIHYGRGRHVAEDGSVCVVKGSTSSLVGQLLECDWQTAEETR